MKLSLVGISEIKPGKHNLKDPRLDQADKLVEAKKKTYAQVDVFEEDAALTADAILVRTENRADLILKDLEFVETRLGREPQDAEKAALNRIKTHLENEQCVGTLAWTPEELQAIVTHNFYTSKPVIAADAAELNEPEHLLLRAVKEAGYICFLTVGGKENRAWLIRQGTTAWEAGGVIHSDIQKGFIRAEIISFEDFIQAGGETPAKRAGKVRLETKQYVMQDCDLVNFRFNK